MCLFFTFTWKLQYFRKLRVLLKGGFPPVCVRQSDEPRSALKRLKKSANLFKVVCLFGFVTIRRYGNRNVWKASGNTQREEFHLYFSHSCVLLTKMGQKWQETSTLPTAAEVELPLQVTHGITTATNRIKMMFFITLRWNMKYNTWMRRDCDYNVQIF